MKTDKEYPATHSMDTAWYFVDNEDNVAIFEIEENGPVPHGADIDHSIQEMCFDMMETDNEQGKKLNFTDDQVLAMVDGLWDKEIASDLYWSYEDAFLIDISKENDFFDYLAQCRKVDNKYDCFVPICLSAKLGIYMVDLYGYKYGKGFDNPHAKFLFDSGIILKHCHIYFYTDYDDERGEYKVMDKMESRCPYYVYTNEWCAAYPHKKVSSPIVPMKLSQMSEDWRGRVVRLNLKFAESDEIQIADQILCHLSGWHQIYTPEGAVYSLVMLPSKEYRFVLDNSMTTEKCKELGVNEDDVYNYIQRFPRVLDESRIDELLKLPENKEYTELRNNKS